ncbi:hypothetical protein Tco_0010234 [Tanacetum coccineum]
METSSLNSEEMELQHMQQNELELHQKCLALFEKLKKHLGFLHRSFNFINPRLFEIAFRIFFREEYRTFREKIYHNLNQLQWQLESDSCHGHNSKTCLEHDSKTCLVVLRTQFKEFFDTKEVNASDFPNKCWQKNFIDVLKYGALRMKEKEVQVIKEIKNRLKEKEIQQQQSLVIEGAILEACLVTKGATLEACLVNEGRALDDNLVIKETTYDSVTSTSSNLRNQATIQDGRVTVQQVQGRHGQNVTGMGSKEKILLVQIQKSGQVLDESSSSGNENRSSDYESSSLGMKTEVLTMKATVHPDMFENVFAHGKKHFAKDMTIESEYCKKIKLLNDEISNLKSQACEKDKTFAKENEKYDEYVQPLFRKENDLKRKFRVLKLDNRRRKGGQTDHTLRLLHPKEDNVRAQRVRANRALA